MSDTTALYSMMDTTDETVSSAVYRVAVRLPPFWPDRPAVWFAQAEAQFELAGITRHTTTSENCTVQAQDKIK